MLLHLRSSNGVRAGEGEGEPCWRSRARVRAIGTVAAATRARPLQLGLAPPPLLEKLENELLKVSGMHVMCLMNVMQLMGFILLSLSTCRWQKDFHGN